MRRWKTAAAAGVAVALSLACVGCNSTASTGTEEEASEETATQVVAEAEGTYVTVDWLQSNLNGVYVVDARSTSAYYASHIPGAVSANWNNLSNLAVAEGEKGWAELLDADTLAAQLALEGITNDRPIVVYTSVNDGWGEDGRTMWTLQTAGFDDVHILDGGWGAWVAADGAMEGGRVINVESTTPIEQVGTAYVKKHLDSAILVDARAEAEYNGETNMGEAQLGHIPGAVNVPSVSLFNQNGALKSADELTQIFEAAGLTDKDAEIITYCTGGVRAANVAEILADQGYTNVSVYAASFAEWAGQGNEVE